MKTIVKSLVIIFLLLKHSLSFSQVDPGDPGNDPGQTVPIDNYIFPILFLAVLLGYLLIRFQVKNISERN